MGINIRKGQRRDAAWMRTGPRRMGYGLSDGEGLILVYVLGYMVAKMLWHGYLWMKERRSEG